MPEPSFDLDFRPASYWADTAVDEDEQRRLAREAWLRFTRIPSADESAGALDAPVQVDDWYLPAFLEDEVEIARVSVWSGLGDAISVRARPDGEGIRYRIIDQFEGDPDRDPYVADPERSDRPPSLGELIGLIDRGVDLDGLRDLKDEGEREERLAYVTVASTYYPDLARYYERDAERWWAQREAEWERHWALRNLGGQLARPLP